MLCMLKDCWETVKFNGFPKLELCCRSFCQFLERVAVIGVEVVRR